MMKPLSTSAVILLAFCFACVAETNSPPHLVATNEVEFARYMKLNRQRMRKGLKSIPIKLSSGLDEALVADGTIPSDEEPDGFSFRFHNTPLPYVLDQYKSLTGKNILVEEGLSAAISFSTDKTVSKAEAIALIEQALALKGIILIPVDKNTVRVQRQPKENRKAQQLGAR